MMDEHEWQFVLKWLTVIAVLAGACFLTLVVAAVYYLVKLLV